MVREYRLILASLVLLISGCDKAESERPSSADNALSTVIEAQVIAAHPEVKLKRYARFYSQENEDYVVGTYLFANEGYEPLEGRAGETYWVEPSDVPMVMDGGCSVFNVRYHILTETLVSAFCNGDA